MKPWSFRIINLAKKHRGYCCFRSREYRVGVNFIAKECPTFQKFIEKFIRVDFHEWLHLFLYDEGFDHYDKVSPATHPWMHKADSILQRCLFEEEKIENELLSGQQMLFAYINSPS